MKDIFYLSPLPFKFSFSEVYNDMKFFIIHLFIKDSDNRNTLEFNWGYVFVGLTLCTRYGKYGNNAVNYVYLN